MVKIENKLTNRFLVYYSNRIINNLLRIIKKEDLHGIEKIVVIKFFSGNNKKNAAIYKRKSEKQPASIEIALESVYNKKLIILMFMPFVGKFLMASVLYHEIGHHCHHSFKHGIKKERYEIFAEKYKKEMLKKALRRWHFFLRPLAPFVRYLANRN